MPLTDQVRSARSTGKIPHGQVKIFHSTSLAVTCHLHSEMHVMRCMFNFDKRHKVPR